MKVTIDIDDALLREARRLAARGGVTLAALVERGLRQVVAQATTRAAPFRLRNASFKGKGLRAELRGAGGQRLRGIVIANDSQFP